MGEQVKSVADNDTGGIVYKAVNKKNGKVYVGITCLNLKRRMQFHARSPVGIFPKAIRKHGIENFDISIIDQASTRNELIEKEIHWIKECECLVPNGYNLTKGGEGTAGYKFPEE